MGNDVLNGTDPSGLEEIGRMPVSRIHQLDDLFRQNRISYPEYSRAQGLLGLHTTVHVRLQSPDTVYGPAALPAGMIRSVKSGIGGVLEHVVVQSHQLATGDFKGATRERVAHSATVLADSTYSPVNLDPMEMLAKAERFLRDPGTDPLDAYQLMVDPTYVPDDRTPDFFLHSNSDALKDFAREVSPEATERAERAVIIYDLGVDVALSVALPELLAAKGAGFVDDAALLGRLDDAVLLERQAARLTMRMPRYMDGGGTLGSWMSKHPEARNRGLTGSIMNHTSARSQRAGVPLLLRDSRIRARISESDIGRQILRAADDDVIHLEFRTDLSDLEAVYRRPFSGDSAENFASVYVRRTQTYTETAQTAVHEGGHALGVAGSRRTEALARLAEVAHQGHPITIQEMRNVLRGLTKRSAAGGPYDRSWRLLPPQPPGATPRPPQSPHFPGVEY